MFNIEPLTFVRGGEPEQFLAETRLRGLWRPTAVALLCHDNKYCVTTHLTNGCKPDGELRKRKLTADLPKGGIDEGETAEYALKRELWEEVCFSSSHIDTLSYLGHALVPFNKSNLGRDGYKKGKLYLIYKVVAKEPLVTPSFAHNVMSVTWKVRFWDHFKVASKKHTLFSQRSLRSALAA